MPSNAEAFFDRLMSADKPFEILASLVNSDPPTCEEEWLDFKTEPPERKAITRMWSEAVSGFANVAGGVLVWGIDARQITIDGQEIDCAGDLRLIEKPRELASRLAGEVHRTTDPPVEGVRVEAIVGPDDKGFVVCFVPEGTSKPYCAEQATGKPYVQRAGRSFVVMNRSLLRSLFYPRASPDLQIALFPEWSAIEVNRSMYYASKIDVRFRGWIANSGQASAEAVCVHLLSRERAPKKFEPAEGWHPVRTMNGGRGVAMHRLLHPGECTQFLNLLLTLNARATDESELVPDENVLLTFKAFAKDTEPRTFGVEWSADGILHNFRGDGHILSDHKPASGVDGPDSD